MNDKNAPHGAWSQPSPRAEMVAEIKSLGLSARLQRLAIRYNQPGHIDDEVVVTLALEAWKAGREHEANTFASELLGRVTKQVQAHVRKNPAWQRLGGGAEEVIADFSEEIVISILANEIVPCHAEVAFGNYVYRRCLDAAAKLYAKKHSAGKSIEDANDDAETIAQIGESIDSLAVPKSPEQIWIENEDFLIEDDMVDKIRHILEEDVPERPRLAFTFRYFGEMKFQSKKKDEITITRVMGVSENTAMKYINQAIDIIKQRLSND